MSEDKRAEQISALTELRNHVVETRRSSVAIPGDKDARIKSIIECQEALRAIDEAMAEEKKPVGWILTGSNK